MFRLYLHTLLSDIQYGQWCECSHSGVIRQEVKGQGSLLVDNVVADPVNSIL